MGRKVSDPIRNILNYYNKLIDNMNGEYYNKTFDIHKMRTFVVQFERALQPSFVDSFSNKFRGSFHCNLHEKIRTSKDQKVVDEFIEKFQLWKREFEFKGEKLYDDA